MERLRNCPNCGGYINDGGRCDFCGSKIYDFVALDLEKPSKTYLRVKVKGKIYLWPVVFNVAEITTKANDLNIEGYCNYVTNYETTGSLEFKIVGDIIAEVG
jgi:hypothetical protein